MMDAIREAGRDISDTLKTIRDNPYVQTVGSGFDIVGKIGDVVDFIDKPLPDYSNIHSEDSTFMKVIKGMEDTISSPIVSVAKIPLELFGGPIGEGVSSAQTVSSLAKIFTPDRGSEHSDKGIDWQQVKQNAMDSIPGLLGGGARLAGMNGTINSITGR